MWHVLTLLGLIRHAYWYGSGQKSERKLSNPMPVLIGWIRESHQNLANSSLVAQLKIPQASEKT